MSDMDLSWSVGHWSFKVTFEWVTRETKNVNSEVFCVCINAGFKEGYKGCS